VLAAVILSGGESRRMGSPKALIPFRGKTFLQHLLDAAQNPQVSPVLVVLGPHADQIRKEVVIDPANVVINQDWQLGQLSSIQAAIRALHARERVDGMMLFLVDHPLISAELVGQLAGDFFRTRKPIVLPTFRGKRGHPVIFSRELFDELLAAPLDQGARVVVWNHADDVLEVPTEEEGTVMNLNDPEVLRKALGTTADRSQS
jgi:molybdenum cofactor cytidylyltransferase